MSRPQKTWVWMSMRPGDDVEAGDVDGLDGGVGGNAYGDFGDLAVLDGYVADGVDVVLGVDDVAAFEEEVVVFCGRVGLSG